MLTTLIMIAWPAYYAVQNIKNLKSSDIALIATVITYSLKLSGLLSSIMNEVACL
jgi:hypothetical protein